MWEDGREDHGSIGTKMVVSTCVPCPTAHQKEVSGQESKNVAERKDGNYAHVLTGAVETLAGCTQVWNVHGRQCIKTTSEHVGEEPVIDDSLSQEKKPPSQELKGTSREEEATVLTPVFIWIGTISIQIT